MPVFSLAQTVTPASGPVKTGIVYDCANENPSVNKQPGDCTFADVIKAVQKILNFATTLALEFSVVVIAWAGWLYMTSGDNASQRDKANKMLFSVAKGIFLVLAAWFIVTLITNTILNKSIIPQFLK